jgi:hypothetical protein
MHGFEFSVVVVNWNGRHFLEECLGSLRKQTFRDFEIILVDNGSMDGSAEFVGQSFPEVKLIGLAENRGFCGGNNEGIRHASGRWIVLLNNDTAVDVRFLEAVYEASRAFPDIRMFASKMVLFDSPDTIDNCGMMACRSGSTLQVGRNSKDSAEYRQYLSVFGPCGGAAFYRRDLLEEVGLLDEDFFMIYEDYDLAFRAQLRGHGCIFVPGALVRHHYHGTIRQHSARQVYFSQRNIEYVFVKDMPRVSPAIAFFHLVYNIGAMVNFTRLGHLWPFLKAKKDAVKALPDLRRKRKGIQRARLLTPQQFRPLLLSGWFRVAVRKALGFKNVASPVISLKPAGVSQRPTQR